MQRNTRKNTEKLRWDKGEKSQGTLLVRPINILLRRTAEVLFIKETDDYKRQAFCSVAIYSPRFWFDRSAYGEMREQVFAYE